MAIALVVCAVFGAAAGIAAAWWSRRAAARKRAGVAQPAPAPPPLVAADASLGTRAAHGHDVAQRKPCVPLPAGSPTTMKVATTLPPARLPVDLPANLQVELAAELTDAEIDALPPELPVPSRRRYRTPHRHTRNFDRL